MDLWFNQTFRRVQMFRYRWDLLIIVKEVQISVTQEWRCLVALCHFLPPKKYFKTKFWCKCPQIYLRELQCKKCI